MDIQRIARITGILWLITFITSIPAVFVFYAPILNDPNYVLGAGADSRIAFGALLEMVLIVANIGTAVVPYSIHKRHNEGLALGFVTARLVECGFIALGLVSLLSVVTLRQDVGGAGARAPSSTPAGRS